MKTLFVAAILVFAGGISGAYADNAQVENAIKSRPDLSSFYLALVDTGVNHELDSDRTYTVFAPTNAAFARLRQEQYPCFRAAECRAQTAAILRNHIFPGTIYVDDAAKQQGSLRSLGGRYVNIGEPSRDDYALDGNNVVYMSSFGGGIIYKIDGVIANPKELASLRYDELAVAPPKEMTSVTKKTIHDPACGADGCPDSLTQTTTTISHGVYAPALAPAR